MAKLRKQVSLEFLEYTKNTLNDLLSSNISQRDKYRICVIIEKLLDQMNGCNNGYKQLYWSKYGQNEWDEAKKNIKENIENLKIPEEYIYGPDYKYGDMSFVSEIQGKWSRRYN